MSGKEKPEVAEVRMDEVEEVLDRAKHSLEEKDYRLLKTLADSYAWLTHVLEQKGTTIGRLRQMLFGATTEKTSTLLGEEGAGDAAAGAAPGGTGKNGEETGGKKDKAKGHGRNGAKNYPGAQKIQIPHPTLSPGDPCPECGKGKVYRFDPPGVILRVRGQAPLMATVYELEKLRCNLCGMLFTAEAPAGIGEGTYDAKAASLIALLRYGSGLPFNRLAGLQESLGIPLPPSTQWDIVNQHAAKCLPAFEELIRQAAQGDVVYNDDTGMTILALLGKPRQEEEPAEGEAAGAKPPRRAVFTSGIVSTKEGRRIALFFTGPRHALRVTQIFLRTTVT